MTTLKDLKLGDNVMLHTFTRSGPGLHQMAKVERLTKTQIILEGINARYSVSDGHPVKSSARGLSYITSV